MRRIGTYLLVVVSLVMSSCLGNDNKDEGYIGGFFKPITDISGASGFQQIRETTNQGFLSLSNVVVYPTFESLSRLRENNYDVVEKSNENNIVYAAFVCPYKEGYENQEKIANAKLIDFTNLSRPVFITENGTTYNSYSNKATSFVYNTDDLRSYIYNNNVVFIPVNYRINYKAPSDSLYLSYDKSMQKADGIIRFTLCNSYKPKYANAELKDIRDKNRLYRAFDISAAIREYAQTIKKVEISYSSILNEEINDELITTIELPLYQNK